MDESVLRGEEDAGRWDLLLAGRAAPREMLIRHLAVVAAVPLVSGVAVVVALWSAGPGPAGALVHGTGIAVAGLSAIAVAALTAQIPPTRAPATGAAFAVRRAIGPVPAWSAGIGA